MKAEEKQRMNLQRYQTWITTNRLLAVWNQLHVNQGAAQLGTVPIMQRRWLDSSKSTRLRPFILRYLLCLSFNSRRGYE